MTEESGLRLVGLDLGSTHVKAVLTDRRGDVLALARRPTPRRSDGAEGTVHPVPELLEVAEAAVAEVVAWSDRPVAAVGIASFAEAGAPVDATGRALADIVAWFDPRPAAAARRIADRIGPRELFERTGLRAEAKVTLAKLAWLREVEPDLLDRMAGWRFAADLVAGTWASGAGTSVTLACRSMAWRLDGRWDDELLALVGLGADRMPPVVPWTMPFGTFESDSSRRLGLRKAIPVAVAGHDHVVGAVAAGVTTAGDVLDSIGTAEAFLLVTAAPASRDEVRRTGFSVGAHVVPGAFTLIAGIQTAGGFVDWMLDVFGDLDPSASVETRHRRLRDLVMSARRRPTGIVVRPTLRGRTAPDPDPDARASFVGIGAADGRGELVLAALEGIAYHGRWIEDELERLTGTAIRRIRLIGGGVGAEALVEVKAALSQATLEVVEAPEAVAVGAALVGGVAAGVLDPAAVLARSAPVRAVEADPGRAAAYEEIYASRVRGVGTTRRATRSSGDPRRSR